MQPPYFSYSIALIGGRPTVNPDIPISAVLLFLYVIGAIANQTIFQLNRRRGHRFYMSWVMFGFCMARVATMVLRIAWTTRETNAGLAIAANIFLNVGVVLIYIVLLVLALRVFRATHPSLGWNNIFRKTLRVAYCLLGSALILIISFTILTFYTLNPKLRNISLWITRASILYFLIINLVTVVLLLLSWLLPRASDSETFGTGSMRSKLIIVAVGEFFSLFIAGFRMGVGWSNARPASNSPWYDGKAPFYVIEFGFEIVVLYLLLLSRFEKRFWVPNGSTKPGDYSRIDKDGSTARAMSSEQDNASDEEKMTGHDKTLEEDETLEQDKTLEMDQASEKSKVSAQDKTLDKKLEEDESSEKPKVSTPDKTLDKKLEEDESSEKTKVSAQDKI